jgi:penicillin-binding protein 1A
LNPPPGQTTPSGAPDRATPANLKTPKRWLHIIGRIVRSLCLVIIGFVAAIAGLTASAYVYLSHDLPSIEKLKTYSPPTVTQFYAENGELIGEFPKERRFVVPVDQIPQMLKSAFVAAEDKYFWVHGDYGPIWWDLRPRIIIYRRIGAPPIALQLPRTFQLPPERRMSRKLKEVILYHRIMQALSKEQILFLYLNQIYLGSGAYGVEAAARTYFDKSVKDLTIAECAMLAGLPKRPSKLSPKHNFVPSIFVKRIVDRHGKVLEEHNAPILKDDSVQGD